MTYRAELDGVRALAIAAVVGNHLGWAALPGGYLGVDAFFVLSGFLITSQINERLAAGRFSLRDFWGRRIRRIMPALLTMILVTAVIAQVWGYPVGQAPMVGQRLAALLSVANIYTLREFGGYWGILAEDSSYLHCWSLSVEEQFYAFFPLGALLVYRWRPGAWRGLLVMATVASLVLFGYGTGANSSATFFLLPTRAWELGAGACLASWPRLENRLESWLRAALGGMGLVGLGSVFAFAPLENRVGPVMILAVVATAAVILGGGEGWGARLLRWRPARYLGLISYGLYLWHWPVIKGAEHLATWRHLQLPDWGLILGMLGVAIVSYHVVEQPLRRHARAGRVIGCGLVLVLAVVLAQYGQTKRPYYSNFAPAEFAGWRYVLNPPGTLPFEPAQEQFGVLYPKPVFGPSAYRESGAVIPGASPEPEVVLLGDSHALMWAPLVAEYARENRVTTSIWAMAGEASYFSPDALSLGGALLTDEQKRDYDDARMRQIARWHPKVLLVGMRLWDGRDIRRTLERLSPLVDRIVVIESPLEIESMGNRFLPPHLSFLGVHPVAGEPVLVGEYSPAKLTAARQKILANCESVPNLSVLTTAQLYEQEGQHLVALGRECYFLDDDHLSLAGARLAQPRLEATLSAALAGENLPRVIE